MQQLHCLGYDWTDGRLMFLHQGSDILINSIDAVTNITNLKAITNDQIPTYCIVTIPTKLTGKCTLYTPCTLEVKIVMLVMLPMVHLKDEVEPAQVLTLINLSYHVIPIAKHTLIRTLQLDANCQELQNF